MISITLAIEPCLTSTYNMEVKTSVYIPKHFENLDIQ